MVKPQQPELRRSDRGATSDDATKERLSAPSAPGVDAGVGRVPVDNLPGHHPEHEQDKPSGRDFVAKMHALAQEEEYEAPSAESEVLEIFGIRPDLTCLGKIIGGGLPVGAYGGAADIMNMVAPAGPVYQAGTLSGNPVAMTAGLWALKRLTPKLYKDLARRGAMLAAGFGDAARAAGVTLHVNAFGSLVTPFFTTSPVRDYDSALTADTGAFATFFRGMLTRGIYPPPSQFEAWFLSAAHTDRDIRKTIDAAHAAMRDVARHSQ